MRLVVFLVAVLLVASTGVPTVAQMGAPASAVTPNALLVIPVKPNPFGTPAQAPARMPYAPGAAPVQGECEGADPALTPAHVISTSRVGNLDKYAIGSSVVNRGEHGQLHTVSQRVEFYVDGTRTQVQTVPRLAVHGVYNFAFAFTRAVDAGPGTTTIEIRYRDLVKSDRARDDCNAANDKVFLKV
jgi:hypothetical protein